MNFEKIYRHGDVLIYKLAERPAEQDANEVPAQELVLELGEVTGHAHRLRGNLMLVESARRVEREMLFEVVDRAVLTHEEHDTIVLEKGIYLKVSQVEYNPFVDMITYVRD